jgi:hypothetical protein
MTRPDTAAGGRGREPGEPPQAPAAAPGPDQLQHPDGRWPEGWLCRDTDGRVVVWTSGSWRALPPPAGVGVGLWEVLAWKLGRDGELP